MMLRTDADHLPAPIREELLHVTTVLFEAFAETTKGRCSEHYRSGRILALILHRPHTEQDWEHVVPGEAFRLLAIVNYPRLARSERDWRLVRDRLRRAWEFGEIARPGSTMRLSRAFRISPPSQSGESRSTRWRGCASKRRAIYRHENGLSAASRNICAGTGAEAIFSQARPFIGIRAMGRWRRCCCIRRASISIYACCGRSPFTARVLTHWTTYAKPPKRWIAA